MIPVSFLTILLPSSDTTEPYTCVPVPIPALSKTGFQFPPSRMNREQQYPKSKDEIQAIASMIEKQAQIVVKPKKVSQDEKLRKAALLAQYANDPQESRAAGGERKQSPISKACPGAFDTEDELLPGFEALPLTKPFLDLGDVLCEASSSAQETMQFQNRRRVPAWTEWEVLDLIAVWGDESVLSELRSKRRNANIFEKISKDMKDRGCNRDPQQCRVKIKELRQAYQKTKEANGCSGSFRPRDMSLL
ncbi:Coiled-coil domain-containing protein 43 [Chelonia mydas]|uniref:Coiled-coil domain-containing protein 43 n=1 Tax=Chelonia mydas TaxID=8469 RepID=M7B5Q7_CHEMY|nr:Coiled-coil domain-containing protein 43 [Chelonia mydas]